MKQFKLLLFSVLMTASCALKAQSLTIINHTAYQILIGMHASDAAYPGCADIAGREIYIPPYTTYSWCDPVDFQSGGSGACGTDPAVGWYAPTGYSFSTVPAAWQWTWANLEYPLVPPSCGFGGFLMPLFLGCSGIPFNNPLSSSCSSSLATWTYLTPLSAGNVQIDLY